MDFAVIAAYIFGLVLLYVLARILFIPLRFLVKLLYNGLLGGLMLWAFNFLGGYIGITVAINPVTALIAGFLGIPGVVLLAAVSYIVS